MKPHEALAILIAYVTEGASIKRDALREQQRRRCSRASRSAEQHAGDAGR
jgi:hypothetical protein